MAKVNKSSIELNSELHSNDWISSKINTNRVSFTKRWGLFWSHRKQIKKTEL
jgi:hypothetical protein